MRFSHKINKESMKGGAPRMKQPEKTPVWRIWVDTKQHIVSFHAIEDAQLLEFHDQAMFFRCVDEYTRQQYRYQ